MFLFLNFEQVTVHTCHCPHTDNVKTLCQQLQHIFEFEEATCTRWVGELSSCQPSLLFLCKSFTALLTKRESFLYLFIYLLGAAEKRIAPKPSE